MEILLISVNRERNPYPVFPLGLSYLAASLGEAGHQLRLLDLCFAEEPLAAIRAALTVSAPAAVVVSVRNIDNVTWPGSVSYLAGIREVIGACRGRAPVILGGSGFSLMPVELLAFLDGDYGVVGEGEDVLPELLACIDRGERPANLPGVLCRGAQGYLPLRLVTRFRRPDRRMFHVDRYHREGGMANLQTKRGCPFSCSYCTYPLLEGRQVRLRPIPEVIAELRELVESFGVSYVYFVDDIFNYPLAYAEELCRAMAHERLPVNWSAFINPQFVTPELFSLMAAAGCDAVEFGSDSGAPAMLQSLGKSFTVEDIRIASRLCREAGIDFAHYILFGGPGESAATVEESFALMDEIDPTTVIAMTGIRIYPGTPLHAQALADGIITHETQLLEPVFYIAPPIRETLCAMVTEKALQRRNWVAPGLELNMSAPMMELLRQLKFKGPMWKMMKNMVRNRLHP